MTGALGRQPLGRTALGRDPVASRKVAGLGTVRIISYVEVWTPGSGEIVAPKDCHALIYAFGGGGSGGAAGSSQGNGGGGGGSAGFSSVRLSPGDKLLYTVGAGGAWATTDGGSTTVTLPDGRVLTAGGGLAGPQGNNQPGGLGGVALGFDVNKNGGAGGAAGPGFSGGGSGVTPPGGGAGGAPSSGQGGGGGGAGFEDEIDLDGPTPAAGTNGNISAASNVPGGGGAGASLNAGGDGALFVYLIRFV